MIWDGIFLRATKRNFEAIIGVASDLRVGLELQMFTLPDSYNDGIDSDLERYKRSLKDFAGALTFHAPYIDLNITSPDNYIREYSSRMFDFALGKIEFYSVCEF